MDAHDLFYQLTRGVRFTDKKQKLQKEKEEKVKREVPVIQESVKEECSNDIAMEDDHQSEEEEEDNAVEFQFIEGTNLAAKPKKKKKKTLLTNEEREKQQEEEMTNILRKENRLTVLGKNVPPPIQQFEELHSTYQLSERLLKNLAACNYPLPTPIQMQAIPIMMKGRHLMACAPTGSGKTIAFLTPVLNDLRAPQKVGFRALILAPTRELAQQIYRECVRLSEKTALRVHIISKVNQAEQKFGPNGSKKCDILISTPNRVRYLLQQEPPLLDLRSVEWFIIDEADRLMDEGKDNFKEQLDDIMAACTNPNKKMALFSATYTVPVSKWVVKHLKNVIRVTVGQQNAATEHVEQELLFVGSESGKLLAIRDMVRTGLKPPVLVFVQSKDRAKQLFNELLYDGINVDVIHADRTQQQRDNCVRAFREGHIWVLICTELMGRGIDFKGVNLVINYDFPPSTISYIHRIGRTGRAGRAGKAITFFTHDDTPSLRGIAEIIKNSGGKVPDFMLKLKKPRKTVLKTLKNYAPKREDISTHIKPEAEAAGDDEKKTGKSAKLEKMKKFMQRKRVNKNDDNDAAHKNEERIKKIKKFNKIEKQLQQNGSAGKHKKQKKFGKQLKNDKKKLKNK